MGAVFQGMSYFLYTCAYATDLENMIKASPYLCVIPVILPISWALHFAHQSPVAIFITCLLGVVPLAGGLGFACVRFDPTMSKLITELKSSHFVWAKHGAVFSTQPSGRSISAVCHRSDR